MPVFNQIPLAESAIKGGIFFGNSLTPSGLFSNVPNTINYDLITNAASAAVSSCNTSLELSLEKLREQLENELSSSVSNDVFKNFLLQKTKLLIDYRDLRNFVFYGSAATEMAYNIMWIINNYPYKAYIAETNINPLVINLLPGNQSEIIFDFSHVIKNSVYKFTEQENLIWNTFSLIDKNNRTYPIIDFEAGVYIEITSCVLGVSTIITTATPHGFINHQEVRIKQSNITDLNALWYVSVTSPTTVEIFRDIDLTEPVEIITTEIFSTGRIRENLVDYFQPYEVRLIIDDVISLNNFITYTENAIDYGGFLIGKNLEYEIEFSSVSTDLQKHLLSPKNNTPWPRQAVTNNIIITGTEYETWITDPNSFQINYEVFADDFGFYSDVNLELNIVSALTLDEEYTNQLVRRAIPHRLLDELTDSDEMFKRLVLIAGWFFDQQKLYINHLQYTKHLNYTDFNQLPLKFYQLYAKHFGLDLFDEDNIDLARLVVQVEPGLAYNLDNTAVFTDTENSNTLLYLQKQKQKRLLKNLLYLYKTKGTQLSLNKLVDLLGIPEGLILLNEKVFQVSNLDEYGYPVFYETNEGYAGLIAVDNDKIHTPNQYFEIDVSKLVNANDVNDPVNKPYHYVLRLSNHETHNLREIDLITDPQNAVLQDILNYGQQNNDYVRLTPGCFLSLQNNADDYYLLPLTFPDKYCGVYIRYNIPRNGFLKTTLGQSFKQDQVVDLASLYQVGSISYNAVPEPNIVLQGARYNYHRSVTPLIFNQQSEIQVISGTPGDAITISVNSVLICTVDFDSNSLTTANIIANYINTTPTTPNYFAVTQENKIILYPEEPSVVLNNQAVVITSVAVFTSTVFSSTFPPVDKQSSYIQCKLENNCLVVRLSLSAETNATTSQRVAIAPDFFLNDGLDHSLRLVYREKGVEIYHDLLFKQLIPWRDPKTTSGLLKESFSIPLNEIEGCTEKPLNIITLAGGSTNTSVDNPRWWDLFIGNPSNIIVDIAEVQVFESREINHVNSLIFGDSQQGYDSEVYHFVPDVQNQVLTSLFKLSVPDAGESTDHHLPLSINNSITKLNAHAFNSFGNEMLFENKQQDFFVGLEDNSLTQILNKKAWDSNLHEVYYYRVLENMIRNYLIFSPQTISYESLLGFTQLIEQKFSALVSQFVPIVVNTNDFIRKISSEIPPKNHYPMMRNICNPSILQVNAQAKIQLKFGEPGDELQLTIGSLLITSNWYTSGWVTLHELKTQVETASSGNIIITVLNRETACVEVNPSWWFTLTGNDINTEVFEFINTGVGIASVLMDLQGGVIGDNTGTCGFSFGYEIPEKNSCKQLYIYSSSEQIKKTFIYSDGEFPLATPPIEYIYAKGELEC